MAEGTTTKGRRGGKEQAQASRDQIGDNLRKLREAKQMTQGGLAEVLVKPDGTNWHFTYVGNIERGTTSPSQAFVRAAAEYFGVTPEDILAEGVSIDDLSEGLGRGRASRRGRKPGRKQVTAAATEEVTPARAKSNGISTDPIGLSLDGGVLKIVTSKMVMTVEGEFDATVAGGRLRLAS